MAQGFTAPFSPLAVGTEDGEAMNGFCCCTTPAPLCPFACSKECQVNVQPPLPSCSNGGAKQRDACSASTRDIQTVLLPRLQQTTQIPNR